MKSQSLLGPSGVDNKEAFNKRSVFSHYLIAYLKFINLINITSHGSPVLCWREAACPGTGSAVDFIICWWLISTFQTSSSLANTWLRMLWRFF